MPVATDEIYEKYLQKAITEINDLGHEVAGAAGAERVPVVGSGHPLRRWFSGSRREPPKRSRGGCIQLSG